MKLMIQIMFLLIIFKISYCSQNWNIYFTGQTNTIYGVFFINQNSGFAVGDNVFLKTVNGGINWSMNSFRHKLNKVYFLNEQTGFVVGKSNDSGFVYKTTNNGGTWSGIFLAKITNPNKEYSRIFFKDNNTGYIIFPKTGYFKTTNGGLFWVLKAYVDDWFRDIRFDNNIYYKVGSLMTGGTLKPAYWTSTDETNWSSSIICNECNNYEQGVYYLKYDSLSYFITEEGAGNKLRRKSDANPSWTTIYSAPNLFFNHYINNPVIHYFSYNNLTTYISTSTNSGYNWVQDTLTDFSVKDIFFLNSSTGFAVGLYGLVAKTTNGNGAIGIQQLSNEVPKSYFLHQNFPNPFNPVTQIKFDLSKNSIVKITIFDIVGRKVETLVNQQLQSGSYKIDWDGTGYSSGVYFYKLETNDFSETKKMIFIK